MRKVEINIDINSAMSICLRAGVCVFPVIKQRKFAVEVYDNGKLIKGNKIYGNKEIANACSKAYKYYAKKILAEQDA